MNSARHIQRMDDFNSLEIVIHDIVFHSDNSSDIIDFQWKIDNINARLYDIDNTDL